ncbi:MAG: metallophosphoesterase family protein, partial [Thermoplasmata archaeon]|nr:metallophosphoesterase family protein [Thermoplasmata archaeon]
AWRQGDPTPNENSADKWLAAGWARENLSEDSVAFLKSLPPERRGKHEGHLVLLTHGSPASRTERLEPATSGKRMKQLAAIAKADIVLCGHSHIPWARDVDGVWFVNPGGVGRSDDGDPKASYVVLDLDRESVRITHRRVKYDVESVADAIRRRGLPEAFARMFLESRTLDAVMKDRQAPRTEAGILDRVLRLARQCRYEIGHDHQVTRLSMDLFDDLRSLHGLGPRARRWLLYAAILHDVGWIHGSKGHNKASLRIIESAKQLRLPLRERRIVGSVARYHRGPHPKDRHRTYASLVPQDRRLVMKLAAILRVADGLDRSHRNVVARISARNSGQRVHIVCQVRGPAEEEQRFAMEKGRLFEEVFNRELVVTCRRV